MERMTPSDSARVLEELVNELRDEIRHQLSIREDYQESGECESVKVLEGWRKERAGEYALTGITTGLARLRDAALDAAIAALTASPQAAPEGDDLREIARLVKIHTGCTDSDAEYAADAVIHRRRYELQQAALASPQVQGGEAVAWRYVYEIGGEQQCDLSPARFSEAWIAAANATETPLYPLPPPPAEGKTA